MAMTATAVALACLPAAAQGAGGFYTGNDLWSHCSGKTAFDTGLCMGYVMGIADFMGTGIAIPGLRACIPSSVTAGQAQDVVKRYLEQHPEQLYYTAASIAIDALEEAFPCPP